MLPLFFLTTVPMTASADKQAVAVNLVACVNSANGYSGEIDGEPWELAQAILEIPNDHERIRLPPDYYFVGGRRLGWHGAWAAFLHLGADGWMAFETHAADDRLAVFAASFVPVEVVEAFADCNVEWRGYWTDEYPLLEVTAEQQPVAPSSPRSLWNGVDLLPPKPND